MKNLFLLVVTLLTPILVTAQNIKIVPENKYLPGRAHCAAHSNVVSYEKGQFVLIALDHDRPQLGGFELYYWFQGEFKPERPTLVYLTGGPGQTSHWGLSALKNENVNVLLVDQRGIGCSRFFTYEQYLNPSFYKSQFVARDLEVLRRSLKIERWTVMGVSYGTIPATMYASFYPKNTRSLILEGVAYDTEQLWLFDGRRTLFQNFLYQLNLNAQNFLKNLDQKNIPSSWAFNSLREAFYRNKALQSSLEQFNSLNDLQTQARYIDNLKSANEPISADAPRNELFLINEVPYFMVACQELAIQEYPTSMQWKAGTLELIPAYEDYVRKNCEAIKAQTTQKYSALQYKIKDVPVYYFQGENDSATEVKGAYAHFQTVVQNKAYLMILDNGGHNPQLELLGEDLEAQYKIFRKALLGSEINITDMEELNQNIASEQLRWTLTSK